MNIIFIAHGGNLIGMGHIMRTLTLADEFKRQKCNVSFISKYSQGIDFIRKRGFDVWPIQAYEEDLHGNERHKCKEELNQDILQIESILSATKSDLIIVDSYHVDAVFFKTLTKYTNCLAYIDDLNAFKYPVNILINGTIGAYSMKYENGVENELMLLGLRYNLIRSEFRNMPQKTVSQFVNHIMVTVGGGDPYNITEKLISFMSEEKWFSKRKLHVVVTNGFPDKGKVEELSKKHENIIIYENPPKMSEIMQISDLAISAGGSTIYELASCGVPILAFCYAENQKLQMELMEKQGLLKNLGYYTELQLENFLYMYKEILENYEERLKMASLGQKLIDCKGTERIVFSVKKYLLG